MSDLATTLALIKKSESDIFQGIDYRLNKQLEALVQQEQELIYGPSGPQGEPGKRGERGIRGDSIQGERGVPGIQGESIIGPQGELGETGLQGESGESITGPQGITGEDGKQGIQGERGFRGSRGEPGELGETGLQGDLGESIIGPQGIQGKQGKQGIPGESITGPQGTRGSRGSQGEIGVGVEGKRGKLGLRGAIGEQGKTGKAGKAGKKGIAGKDAEIEDIVEDFSDRFNKMQRDFQIRINDAITRMAGTGGAGTSGGGSVNILDNDDVVFTYPQDVSNNSVLVFDTSINKFVTLPLNGLVDAILAATKYTKLIDKVGDLTYIGEADPGTAESAATWRIARIDEALDPDLQITWADGTADFIKVWDDRATYTYS